MGINPTPTNHRSFTFDGKSTREFGVYTTGKDVFNSPERAVEMISIPGRDGEYALDQGHFNNIEVTYRAGIVADSTTDFAEAISNFRNWLASRKGYCRLTDEYNTEEYRMAVFNNAIALEHEGLLTGEFDVTFDCEPQRFLAIGEELVEIGAWGNTETAEGEVVTIEASSDTAVKSLVAEIVPIQSGSGTPSPDNVRPISGHDEVGVSVAGKNLLNDETPTVVNGYLSLAGIIQANANNRTVIVAVKPNTTYSFTWNRVAITSLIDDCNIILFKEYPIVGTTVGRLQGNNITTSGGVITITTREDECYIAIKVANITNTNFDATLSASQLELGTTATAYEPYNGNTYTTTLPSTTYGGTLDVVSGLLTVTHGIVDMGSLTWSYESGYTYSRFYATIADKWKPTDTWVRANGIMASAYEANREAIGGNIDGLISGYQNSNNVYVTDSRYTDANAFKTAMTGQKICYELATPTTTTLTPQQITLLLGENNIFADSGNVTVEYGHNPTILTNPTWFPSKPLLAVEGYGEIKFNDRSIVELENATIGDVVLSEQLSAYEIIEFNIDTNLVNVGDSVTLNIKQYGMEFVAWTAYKTTSSVTINDSNSNFHTTYNADNSTPAVPRIDLTTTLSTPITITVGTSATITNTVSGVWTLTGSSNTVTFSYDTEVYYYSSIQKVRIQLSTPSITISGADISDAGVGIGNNRPLIVLTSAIGHSSVLALGNPTYIDCDIGEAYMVKDGEPISLNQYIDLGSDLPTLPSGDTEVTYDNTITKVEVQPNWWKV